MPLFVRITPAREHEIKTARLINLNPGSIVAMDKAFNDYQLFAVWTEKDRWEIELFFKTFKQNLKIKTFTGTSEKALHIQIWTALISLLVLKWLHYMSKAGWSFFNTAPLVRLNLFTYRDLTDWLNSSLSTEPIVPSPEQIPFPFTAFGQAMTVRQGTTSI